METILEKQPLKTIMSKHSLFYAVVGNNVVSLRSTQAETEATLDVDTVTEGPVQPIKLTKMDVKSVISMRYAHTAIVAHVRNAANKSQEANFRVLLPDTAFISGFVMYEIFIPLI